MKEHRPSVPASDGIITRPGKRLQFAIEHGDLYSTLWLFVT